MVAGGACLLGGPGQPEIISALLTVREREPAPLGHFPERLRLLRSQRPRLPEPRLLVPRLRPQAWESLTPRLRRVALCPLNVLKDIYEPPSSASRSGQGRTRAWPLLGAGTSSHTGRYQVPARRA